MSMSREALLRCLETTARERFGSDRAAELRAALEALADDLARMAATSLPPAAEPDFASETEPVT
jgi:hypothetical protein